MLCLSEVCCFEHFATSIIFGRLRSSPTIFDHLRSFAQHSQGATDGKNDGVWHAGNGDYPSSLTLNLGVATVQGSTFRALSGEPTSSQELGELSGHRFFCGFVLPQDAPNITERFQTSWRSSFHTSRFLGTLRNLGLATSVSGMTLLTPAGSPNYGATAVRF